MANSLYPGFIKLFYTVSNLQHTATLPVLPFEGVGGWWVMIKSTSVGEIWTAAVDDYVNAVKILFTSASSSFLFAELWTYDSPESDPIFRDTYQLDQAGTATGSPVQMSQAVMSLRTEGGGILKAYLMETVLDANLIRNPPNFGHTGLNALETLLTGPSGFVVGRDGTFPIAAIRVRTKTNDALRRKRQLFS